MRSFRGCNVTKKTKQLMKKTLCLTLAVTVVLPSGGVSVQGKVRPVYAMEEGTAVPGAVEEAVVVNEGREDVIKEAQESEISEKETEIFESGSEEVGDANVKEEMEVSPFRESRFRIGFKPVTDITANVGEVTVGQEFRIADMNAVVEPANATNQTIKWALFDPSEMGVTFTGRGRADIDTFTAREKGFVWLRASIEKGLKPENSPWTNDGEYHKYFKITVKGNAGEVFEYPTETYKENLKPLKAPIQFGYFRTWHDYWSEAPWSQSSNHFGDAPEEVDILSVFHAYTEEDNPFWEKLKYEYVPKLNKQGTRVVRTINIRDLDGREGVSRELGAGASNADVARRAVEKYVDAHNLDGLDVDFEAEHLSGLNFERAKGVILEIGKLIGRQGKRKNILFMIDTDLHRHAMFSKEILDNFDYLIRQNYRHDHVNSYNYFKDAITKDRFLTGFSYYEERGNAWGQVPYVGLVADETTNELKMADPNELFARDEFKRSDAYKQAVYAVKEGYGGLFSYAIDRDGIRHGNDIKFFRKDQGGHPTKYFFSKALKRLMLYEAHQDVTEIVITKRSFEAGKSLALTAEVEPANATNREITWSIVQDATTAAGARIDGTTVTATGEGNIRVKAVIENGKKGSEAPQLLPFERQFEITVTKAKETEELSIKVPYVIAGQTVHFEDPEIINNPKKEKLEWMLFHSGTTAPEGIVRIVDKKIKSFKPIKPGFVWLRATVKKNDKIPARYFKLMVKESAEAAEPSENYPEAFPKEKIKPLKGPVQLAYFRTWHDYWSWTPDDSSNKIGHIPPEIDILAIFPAYTEDNGPFWEKVKYEYVPKLNAQGTRVIRTIGAQNIDGTAGPSKTFKYEKNPEGYKKLAEEIVRVFVTEHNLDGLDIDFEEPNGPLYEPKREQVVTVINEIGKIIGRKNAERGDNMLFILDTNLDANSHYWGGILPEIKDNFDYIIRQNYGVGNETQIQGKFSTYEDIIPKERYMTGFSFYEEGDRNFWQDVPKDRLAADDRTNAPLINDPNRLLAHWQMKWLACYTQPKWAAEGGYGGVFSYAVDRDGVRHGNDQKFFRNDRNGHPSSYFYSKLAKNLLRYYSIKKDVTGIELTSATEVEAGKTLKLEAEAQPLDATRRDISWSIEESGTTAEGPKLEGDTVSATGAGTIRVKARIEHAVRVKEAVTHAYEKTFDITVKGSIPFTPVDDITLSVTEFGEGETLILNEVANIQPETLKDKIVWSLVSATANGAGVNDGVVSANGSGTVTVKATVPNGKMGDQSTPVDYEKEFVITVKKAFVAVTNLELSKKVFKENETLNLNTVVNITPEELKEKIVWSLVSATAEGAKVENGVVSANGGGTVRVKATVPNGKMGDQSTPVDYEKEFDLTVKKNIVGLTFKLTETVVGRRVDLNDEAVVENEFAATTKWMIYHPGTTGVLKDGIITDAAVTEFTPTAPGFIWLKAEIKNKPSKYFKITVKENEAAEAPAEYPEAFPKEQMKPFEGPIQLGYFRTWHDYWVWTGGDSSHKISDVPAEVDIVAVFPDYTDDESPFWEKLKFEYVPKLNRQGTRVIRTIGIKDVDGRRGVSKDFEYTKDAEGYKKLAEEIVKHYVTDYNLDGLDIDFEHHDSYNMSSQNISQAIAVINEIGKIIGRKNKDRRANMLFLLDTNKDATDADGIFRATVDNYDYVIRQNYGASDWMDSRFRTYNGILPKERYLTGFSFYEENGNRWNDVPSASLAADDTTNAPKLSDADELFKFREFKGSGAYKQAQWAASGGYGGIISYAVERDGVRHGNNNKFFKVRNGGKPSSYFFSKALKRLMLFESHKEVTNVTLTSDSFTMGESLVLNATVAPDTATKKDITWSLVSDKTTAQGAKLEGTTLTADGAGKVVVKATIEKGKKGELPNLISYEQEFEITVKEIFKPVESLTLSVETFKEKQSLNLQEAVVIVPEELKEKIVWNIVESDAKDAKIEAGVLSADGAGKVKVKAVVRNGKMGDLMEPVDYEKEFTITVTSSFVPVPIDTLIINSEGEPSKKNEEEKKTDEVEVDDTKTPEGSLEQPESTGMLAVDDIVYKMKEDKKTAAVKEVNAQGTTLKLKNRLVQGEVNYKITSLLENALKGNKKLKKLILGKYVTTIGKNCFKGCSNFRILEIKALRVKAIGKNAFLGVNKAFTVIVSKKMKSREVKKLRVMLEKAGVKAKIVKK